MPKLFSLLRSRKAVTSASHSLRASAQLPTFDFLALENSRGASAAGAEFSQYLDDTLTTLDFSGERALLERKVRVQAARYGNSRLGDGAGTEWGGGREEAALVCVAARCAKAVYDTEEAGMEGFEFTGVQRVEATAGGTTKCTVLTEVRGADLEVLVIAVRGSSSAVDWVVNANGNSSDASEFLLKAVPTASRIACHSGFLNAALVLEPLLRKTIDGRKPAHVVFTGHSAGGAVASLLFARFLSTASDISYSLISFGAPPVTNPCITPLLQAKARLNLAVVNEGDPVARIDPEYVKSLVDLYRVACGLDPEPGEAAWKVPKQCMFAIGDVLVLRDAGYDKEDGVDLRAVVVDRKEFGDVLFANVAVHKRDMYLENAEMMFQGLMNGRDGWGE